jgi:DNA mismatch repair protein MutS
MPFQSILFEQPADYAAADVPAEPPFFTDLNLDQVGRSMAFDRAQYELTRYFLMPLHSESAVNYRHQVLRDLQDADVRIAVGTYARDMNAMRQCLTQANKLRYKYQRQRWFLAAVDIYCRATSAFAEQCQELAPQSAGLLSLREYLDGYARSGEFKQTVTEARDLMARLAEVRYCVHIRGSKVRVTRYAEEEDYGADVAKTFAKFKQGAVKDYRIQFRTLADMDHVEAQILELVAKLYPEIFRALDDFCQRHDRYADETLRTFDREVQFYLAYLDYIRPMKSAGLEFCYPMVSADSKHVDAEDAFDIALASKLAKDLQWRGLLTW